MSITEYLKRQDPSDVEPVSFVSDVGQKLEQRVGFRVDQRYKHLHDRFFFRIFAGYARSGPGIHMLTMNLWSTDFKHTEPSTRKEKEGVTFGYLVDRFGGKEDFEMDKEVLERFRSHNPYQSVAFEYRRNPARPHRSDDISYVQTVIVKSKKGKFSALGDPMVKDFDSDELDGGDLLGKDEIDGAVGKNGSLVDFRPYLHRMIELYADVPESEQHDPGMYAQRVFDWDRFVDDYIDLVFPNAEGEELKLKIRESRMMSTNGWPSIPSMSLGKVVLPEITRNERNDHLMFEGTALFIEQLQKNGIEGADHYLKVIERKVTNHILHNTEFQSNPRLAAELISRLKGQ